MAQVRLGAGIFDRLLFRDGFCFPLEMMAATSWLNGTDWLNDQI
jgi:hypothetical protein